MEKKKLSLGVLVSGSGSNLQSIIDSIERGILNASIEIVISNNPDAFALERASKHNLESIVIDHAEFQAREDFDRKMIDVLTSHSVDLVIMAGFMRILSPLFLKSFPMKIINIHPALLPSFQGLHAQRQAFDYGVRFSGCTVHFANEGVDTGPIIIQSVVPVYEDDTEESLQKRILKEEHRIYPQAIQFIAEGKVEISGRKVKIRDHEKIDDKPIHNPPLVTF
ncbi:MAG: phosphoribosylglycinamide formyltransferase [Deltaproteobacteria bacterium]|nr:phosphoribosylglycinamide formyltransferase [Deltaproteobacteria bacterium]